jgi:hypothetical protein
MEGVRKPGAGSLLDSGGGRARSADATPGKRTLTMGLDAAQPTVRNGAPVTGADAAERMGPGRALDSAAATAAGTALGEMPGDVQVHTGPEAARFASQHGARALAVGEHIAFGAGEYQPGTSEGDTLIAHEVAHTVQMKGADVAGPIGHSDAGAEREADDAARSIVTAQHGIETPGETATISRRPLALRKDDKTPKDDPVKTAALKLADEIGKEVVESTRDKVRDRLYAEISAPNKVLARDRRAGKVPELTGLGATLQIDEMVRRFRDFLPRWSASGMDAKTRALAMYQLAQAMLVTVGVPQFEDHTIDDMKPKGAFSGSDWQFHFQLKMMENAAPTKDEQADLINAVAHESRHAEQAWVSARVAAGKGMSPSKIASAVGILPKIAGLAKDKPITDKNTKGAELAFANAMFDAEVTHKTANDDLEGVLNTTRADLIAKNDACAAAVAKLRATPTAAQMKATTDARDAMRAAVTAYTKAYRDYRKIPFEADAHEVGDAAGVAFLENP